jgi:hypothetical protein
MWSKLWKEVAARKIAESPREMVKAAELAALPPTVRRYMHFYGIEAGQPKHASMQLRWTGEFKLGRDKPWMPIEAVQFDTREPVARIFHMRARMKRVIPVLARDTYVEGHGRMCAKIADLLPVVDASGAELDRGELVTWLNDCVLLAPSMLLGVKTRWSDVDTHTFDVEFSDRGVTVKARVYLDDRSAPLDFETSDRWLKDPDDPKHALIRAQWRTPVLRYRRVGERDLPALGLATWILESGDFTYARFQLDTDSLAFDQKTQGSGGGLIQAA